MGDNSSVLILRFISQVAIHSVSAPLIIANDLFIDCIIHVYILSLGQNTCLSSKDCMTLDFILLNSIVSKYSDLEYFKINR